MEKIPFSPMYIKPNQIWLSNTFDNTTEIHCALTGVIKMRGSLLTFAYIVDFPMYILKTMCSAFDRAQTSHRMEVNLVLHLPHSFQRQFQNTLPISNKLHNALVNWAQISMLLHQERELFILETKWPSWEWNQGPKLSLKHYFKTQSNSVFIF